MKEQQHRLLLCACETRPERLAAFPTGQERGPHCSAFPFPSVMGPERRGLRFTASPQSKLWRGWRLQSAHVILLVLSKAVQTHFRGEYTFLCHTCCCSALSAFFFNSILLTLAILCVFLHLTRRTSCDFPQHFLWQPSEADCVLLALIFLL